VTRYRQHLELRLHEFTDAMRRAMRTYANDPARLHQKTDLLMEELICEFGAEAVIEELRLCKRNYS